MHKKHKYPAGCKQLQRILDRMHSACIAAIVLQKEILYTKNDMHRFGILAQIESTLEAVQETAPIGE